MLALFGSHCIYISNIGCNPFMGWAHGLSFHSLGGPWRTLAITVKNKQMNATIKVYDKIYCYRWVKYRICVYCLVVKCKLRFYYILHSTWRLALAAGILCCYVVQLLARLPSSPTINTIARQQSRSMCPNLHALHVEKP